MRAYLAEVTSQDTLLDKRVQWHTKLAQQLVEEELLATSGDSGGGDGDDGNEGGDGGNDDTGFGDEKNKPPVARIRTTPGNVGDGSLEKGQTVTLDASKSADGDSEIVEYMWDLDSDGSFETEGKNAKLPLNKCGSYRVVLQVTDDKGEKSTDEVFITTVK